MKSLKDLPISYAMYMLWIFIALLMIFTIYLIGPNALTIAYVFVGGLSIFGLSWWILFTKVFCPYPMKDASTDEEQQNELHKAPGDASQIGQGVGYKPLSPLAAIWELTKIILEEHPDAVLFECNPTGYKIKDNVKFAKFISDVTAKEDSLAFKVLSQYFQVSDSEPMQNQYDPQLDSYIHFGTELQRSVSDFHNVYEKFNTSVILESNIDEIFKTLNDKEKNIKINVKSLREGLGINIQDLRAPSFILVRDSWEVDLYYQESYESENHGKMQKTFLLLHEIGHYYSQLRPLKDKIWDKYGKIDKNLLYSIQKGPADYRNEERATLFALLGLFPTSLVAAHLSDYEVNDKTVWHKWNVDDRLKAEEKIAKELKKDILKRFGVEPDLVKKHENLRKVIFDHSKKRVKSYIKFLEEQKNAIIDILPSQHINSEMANSMKITFGGKITNRWALLDKNDIIIESSIEFSSWLGRNDIGSVKLSAIVSKRGKPRMEMAMKIRKEEKQWGMYALDHKCMDGKNETVLIIAWPILSEEGQYDGSFALVVPFNPPSEKDKQIKE